MISRTNETHYISWHGTCACKCRLDATVCNDRQRLNSNKCRCECKELIDKVDKVMGLYEILLHVNVINHGMLVNT